jgi:peptide/nickel transport system permease protein
VEIISRPSVDESMPYAADSIVGVAVAGAAETPARTTVVAGRPRRRRPVGLWLAIGWLSMLTLAAVLADVLPLQAYDRFTDLPSRTAPGWRWPEFLGTDSVGRSVLSRLIYGARQSLQVGLISVGIGATVGSLLGLAAGYLRGKVDELVGIVLDALLAIPALVLLLAIAAIGSRNVTTLIIGLAIFLTAPFARLVRASTMSLADREFVDAARAMGATRRRIMFRELLPSVVPGVVSVVFLYAATVIVAEGTLSFLGLGIPPPKPSWGGMINDGRQFIEDSPAVVFVPSAAVLITVISLRRVGEHIRSRLVEGGGRD